MAGQSAGNLVPGNHRLSLQSRTANPGCSHWLAARTVRSRRPLTAGPLGAMGGVLDRPHLFRQDDDDLASSNPANRVRISLLWTPLQSDLYHRTALLREHRGGAHPLGLNAAQSSTISLKRREIRQCAPVWNRANRDELPAPTVDQTEPPLIKIAYPLCRHRTPSRAEIRMSELRQNQELDQWAF